MRNFLICGLVAVVVLVSVPRTAVAYILPTQFVIKMLTDQRKGTRVEDLSLQMTTEYVDGDAAVQERLYLKSPHRMRWVEESDNGRLYVEKAGRFARGTASRVTPGKGPVPELLATFLTPAQDGLAEASKKILATLRAHGVDTGVITLGRFEGRVAFIIGAKSWEKDKPQVWVDKDLFLPVRFMVPDSSADGALGDTRLMEWGSPVAAYWFPRVIERYRAGKLVSRSEVTEAQRNQQLPETLFDWP